MPSRRRAADKVRRSRRVRRLLLLRRRLRLEVRRLERVQARRLRRVLRRRSRLRRAREGLLIFQELP